MKTFVLKALFDVFLSHFYFSVVFKFIGHRGIHAFDWRWQLSENTMESQPRMLLRVAENDYCPARIDVFVTQDLLGTLTQCAGQGQEKYCLIVRARRPNKITPLRANSTMYHVQSS